MFHANCVWLLVFGLDDKTLVENESDECDNGVVSLRQRRTCGRQKPLNARSSNSYSGFMVATTTTDSTSLTARQRARKATEERREQLKRRESALADVFASLDDLDALHAKVGRALNELLALGENNTTAGELVGLTPREVGNYIRAAKDAAGGDGSTSDDNNNAEPSPGQGSDNVASEPTT